MPPDNNVEEISEESTFDYLDEETTEEKLDLTPDKEEKPSEKEETVELEEDEDSDKESKEKEDDEVEIHAPPRNKEILAKYPNIWKDFPGLKAAYYREQQFTELIGHPNDAKELVSKATALDNFEQYLSSGETEKILQSIKQVSPEAFNKVVDNYLATLGKVDQNAYHHIVGNTIKHTIMAMVQEGKRSDNGDLLKAANLLNQFVFASSEFEAPVKLSTDNPKNEEVSQRERELNIRQFNTARDSLNTKIDNVLRSTIEAYIDPKESMSSYVRKNAVREVLESVPELVREDKRFDRLINDLWARAFKENYSQNSLDRIKSAWLSRAKTVMPAVIKKVRGEALKGLGSKKSDDETPRKGPAPVGKAASSTNSGSKSVKEKVKAIPAGISTLDYLLSED